MSIEKTNIKTNVAILIIYISKFWQIVFFAAFCARLFHKRFERLSCKPLQRILLRKAFLQAFGRVFLQNAFLQAFGALFLRKAFLQAFATCTFVKGFPTSVCGALKAFPCFSYKFSTFCTFCVETGKTFLLFCGNAVNITVIILFIIDVLLQFIFKTMQNHQIRAKNISVLYRK